MLPAVGDDQCRCVVREGARGNGVRVRVVDGGDASVRPVAVDVVGEEERPGERRELDRGGGDAHGADPGRPAGGRSQGRRDRTRTLRPRRRGTRPSGRRTAAETSKANADSAGSRGHGDEHTAGADERECRAGGQCAVEHVGEALPPRAAARTPDASTSNFRSTIPARGAETRSMPSSPVERQAPCACQYAELRTATRYVPGRPTRRLMRWGPSRSTRARPGPVTSSTGSRRA